MYASEPIWNILGISSNNRLPHLWKYRQSQESGQLLINMARHCKHVALASELALVAGRWIWGDKDAFRLAWLAARAAA